MAAAHVVTLCDTNILIEFYKGNQNIISELRQIGAARLSISVITEGELYVGARNKAELQAIQRHLAGIARWPLDEAITARFLELLRAYTLSHGLSIPDALIAATALVHGLPLYTLNLKDFRYISALILHPVSRPTS